MPELDRSDVRELDVNRDLWGIIVNDYGRLRVLVFICGLTIIVALLEGINMGLLVPLLETLDSTEQGGGHWVTRSVSSLFGSIGLSYNLGTVLMVLSGLILFTSGLKYLVKRMTVRERESFIVWLRSRSMRRLMDADMSYFHQEKMGILADTLTTQTSRAGATLSNSLEIIASVGIGVTYLVTAFLIAPLLAAVAVAMVVLVTISMHWYIIKARTMGAVRVTNENDLLSAAVETLGGIHVIKSFLLERLRNQDFSEKAEDAGDTGYAIGKNLVNMEIIQELALFGLIAAVVYVGVTVLNLGIAVIIALLFILYRLAPRVSGLNAKRQGLAAAVASLQAVKTTIDDPATPKIIGGETPFVGLANRIEIKDVVFSYNGDSEVLRRASFVVEKGKMTAIAGTSGAGKSTLIELILRYYDPVEGAVYVDGTDLRDLDLTSWRNSIGIVSQDVFLFNDTVLNNIALGRANVTRDAVVDAASRAYANDFIEQLPHGYETQIGDRGWNLSGGQRQRLALARAILKNPEILILDEATSSLDSGSESMIHNYVESIRCTSTIIIVAHRMSTIKDADKIVVLEDGRIIEEGDWDSLGQETGPLANLYRLQTIQ